MKTLLVAAMALCMLASKGFGQSSGRSDPDSLDGRDFLEQVGEQLPLTEEPADEDLLEGFIRQIPKVTLDLRSRLTGRFPLPRGFREGGFEGSSVSSYHRLKLVAAGKIGASFLLKKDPGERRIDDLFSWNLFVRNFGPLSTTLVAGDFVVEGGLGLMLWSPYGLKKGGDVMAPLRRVGRGPVPQLSSDQIHTFRGLAAAFRIGNAETILWYSRRSLAATFSGGDEQAVTGFHSSGLFRTVSEIAKRDAVGASVIGGRTTWNPGDRFRCGLTWMASAFSTSLAMGALSEGPRDRLQHCGFDIDFNVGGARLLGEGAGSFPGGKAYLLTLFVSPWENLEGVLSIRETGKGYFTQYGSPFGESSTVVREQGIYLGITTKPMAHLRISWYADRFGFPGGRSGSVFLTNGTEQLFRLEYTGVQGLHSLVQASRAISGMNRRVSAGDGEALARAFVEEKQRYRLQLDYRVSRSVKLRGRIEYAVVTKNPAHVFEDGLLCMQQLQVTVPDLLDVQFRLVMFRSDSYESGIGLIDLDLPGSNAMPVLYGRGIRFAFLMKYDLSRVASLAVKYSELFRDDVRKIGTGLDELPSNRDSRFGLQLDFRY